LRGLERRSVKALIEACGGVADGMAFMTGTGGEKLPEGVDPKSLIVERSMPLKAFEDAILAWELNGSPLPLAHGGPLRLIVPGYTGVNNINTSSVWHLPRRRPKPKSRSMATALPLPVRKAARMIHPSGKCQ
jgi:DMSO/TMAO reductase YedYZ molybdopterin-dependent catalytic subunit